VSDLEAPQGEHPSALMVEAGVRPIDTTAEVIAMSNEPTLTEQTKKIFLDTVDLYRNDALKLVSNPIPAIVLIGIFALLWIGVAMT
jgi:hypothetical protein